MTEAYRPPVCDRFKANITVEVPSPQIHVLRSFFIHAAKNVYAVVVCGHAGTSSHHVCKRDHMRQAAQMNNGVSEVREVWGAQQMLQRALDQGHSRQAYLVEGGMQTTSSSRSAKLETVRFQSALHKTLPQ